MKNYFSLIRSVLTNKLKMRWKAAQEWRYFMDNIIEKSGEICIAIIFMLPAMCNLLGLMDKLLY